MILQGTDTKLWAEPEEPDLRDWESRGYKDRRKPPASTAVSKCRLRGGTLEVRSLSPGFLGAKDPSTGLTLAPWRPPQSSQACAALTSSV